MGDMVDSAPRHVRHLETWRTPHSADLHPDVVEHCVSARNVRCRNRPPLGGRRLPTIPGVGAFDGLGSARRVDRNHGGVNRRICTKFAKVRAIQLDRPGLRIRVKAIGTPAASRDLLSALGIRFRYVAKSCRSRYLRRKAL